MDPIRFGRALRALRRRKRWRQQDVAERARVSQPTISRLERGSVDEVAIAKVERVAHVLEARLEIVISWQGEPLDRLLDAEHAGLVESVVRLLTLAGWEVAAEVSFNERGDRGIVDVLAWHRSRTLLVVEVKSVIADVQGTIGSLDRKARVSPLIARRRGWLPRLTARLLVVADTRTGRRRVADHEAAFAAAFPMRGRDVLRWLRRPSDWDGRRSAIPAIQSGRGCSTADAHPGKPDQRFDTFSIDGQSRPAPRQHRRTITWRLAGTRRRLTGAGEHVAATWRLPSSGAAATPV